MKLNIFIDKNREEEITIYAKENSKLIEEIKDLVLNNSIELIGFKDKTAVVIDLPSVICFVVEENKIYAHLNNEKLLLKCRLYHLENTLPKNFVKINQSTIANINKIKSFDASFSGSLAVNFENGYKDYVSRRNTKNIKERFGL